MLKVPSKTLLLVAAAVWMAAGISVVSVGIHAAVAPWTRFMAFAALVVFVLFLLMFLRISNKHIKRILGYTQPLTNIFLFFDAQSYVMVAVMMGLGVFIRVIELVPGDLIAFFYTGLGSALIVSAIYYVVTYLSVCSELSGSVQR